MVFYSGVLYKYNTNTVKGKFHGSFVTIDLHATHIKMQYAGQTGNLVFACEKGVTSQFAVTGN
jgi:hypothetical protein